MNVYSEITKCHSKIKIKKNCFKNPSIPTKNFRVVEEYWKLQQQMIVRP